MTEAQLEKYKKWTEYGIKSILTLCFGAVIALGTHYVEAQSIHKDHSKRVEQLEKDSKKTIVIPNSIKLNEYKINQCNKTIDEVKKDLKEVKLDMKEHQKEQNQKMAEIISLLMQMKRDR